MMVGSSEPFSCVSAYTVYRTSEGCQVILGSKNIYAIMGQKNGVTKTRIR